MIRATAAAVCAGLFAFTAGFGRFVDTDCVARSSDWLSLLPDGPEKRAFVLDCTGCHQFGGEQALDSAGAPRTEADWTAVVARMVGYAGATTAFPVIAADRDPARTAAWLRRHLAGRTPVSADCARPLPAGATVTEYAMPEPRDLPHDVAVDARGRVIVTGMFTHVMYVLDPDSGKFSEVAIPVPRANPRAVEIDRSGDWWVVLGGPKQLARYQPATGAWRTWDVGVYPHSLATDGQGRAWFNGHFTRAPEVIGFLSSAADSAVRVHVPAHPSLAAGPGGPIPYELRAGPDGRVWGSELLGNRVFAYDPGTGTFTVRDMPTPVSGPRRFDIDRRGVVWIPAYAANALVRYDPAADRFESFALPRRDAVPYVVRIDHGTGVIWIGTSAADALYAFDPPTRAFTAYPLPSRGALVRHLAIDPRTHDVWIAYGASPGIPARIARLRVGAVSGQTPAFFNINPSWSPDGRRLVFQTERHGRTSLYIINADGTGERRLTTSGGEDTHPAWSPDGQLILFDSHRDSVWNLFVIRPDGTGERRLTNPGAAARGEMFARHPAWSPDGRHIAFDSDRDGDEDVYVMDADGGGARRLTNSTGRDGHAAWSPDGRRLLFGSARAGNGDIWIMNADGTDPRSLIAHPAEDGGARFSPDGRRVVFFSARDGNARLYAVNADGSGLQDLSRDTSVNYEHAWSPDGRRIAFYSSRTGRFELYVMDADGRNQRQLTWPHHNAWPQWSPDGRRIVFASTRDGGGDWEIYTMAGDGSDARRLTATPGRDAHPMFLPGGNRIVFQSPRGASGDDQVDLYSMDTRGGSVRRLVAAPGFNGVPVPSPDGRWIAFQRGTRMPTGDWHWELVLVDTAGRGERRLTTNAWSSQVPSWSPDGRHLAFFANPGGRDQLFLMDLTSRAVTPVAPSAGSDNAPAFAPDGRSLAFVSTRDGSRDLYRVAIGSGTVTRLTTGLDVWSQSWSPDGRRLLFSAVLGEVFDVHVVNADGTGLQRLTGPGLP